MRLRTTTRRDERQRRPARARPRRRQRRGDARARLRRVAGRGGRHRRGLARREVRQDAQGLREGLEGLRRLAEQAARRSSRASTTRRVDDARRRVLPERERAQGVRGQDVPRRDRREPRVAVGPGGLGRRSGQHVLRLVPRGVRARPLRGVDGSDGRRRPRDRARRDAVPVRAPAASRRVDAAQQPRQRQDRAGLVQHAARRVRVPDPDGVPARARPTRRSTRTTSSRPRTSSPRTARRSASERWEEQGGYSPSTIAAEIAGLVAAAEIAKRERRHGVGRDLARRRRRLPALDQGLDGDDERARSDAPRYFIRLSKTGDPNAAITYNVGNGGPTLDQRDVIDAGFLELVRLGELPADDPDVLASLPVVDATIETDTASGPGWHRYNGDGYGDGAGDGRPWAPSGQGHRAPLAGALGRARRAGARDRRHGDGRRAARSA